MEVVFVIVVIVLIIAGIFYSFYAAKKRREEMTQFANQHGLRFVNRKDYDFDSRYHYFSCLQKGKRRNAYNFLRGAWKEHEMVGFDYHYQTESRDSDGKRKTQNHYFSGVILTLNHPFKHLFIRPEGFFDKVTEFFGYDDIDFESAEFSRKFYVKAEEKKWAYDVIHTRTMEFLLDQPRFTMEFVGNEVIVYRSSKFKVEEFGHAADLACGILERLPDYVMRELTDTQGITGA